jgi:hypothetical protein
MHKKTLIICLALFLTGMAGVLLFSPTTLHAADTPKLVAPIYKGAVPAVLADGAQVDDIYTANFGGIKALDCEGFKSTRDYGLGRSHSAQEAAQAGYVPGPWCFLTRDPIDKVKAFYDKAVGPMQPIQGEKGVHGFEIFVERAWGEGEESSGFYYTGVSVHALPPPPVKSKKTTPATSKDDSWEGQEDFKFYGQFKHLGLFMNSVGWFGDEPGKRKPAEMEEMYKKYSQLYSAFFQHKGPESKAVDDTLIKHYEELQGQRQQAALMAPISARRDLGMASMQAGSKDRSKEDDEVNSIMQRNPELARRYVALTQKVSVLMQQGKFDEADAVLDEIDALEQSNPELAALANKEQARQNSAQAAGQAQEDAIDAAANEQMDKALWGTAMEYIQAVDKEDYYTLIVIDNALAGIEKDYSRDQALIARETAGMIHQQDLRLWGIQYKQSRSGTVQPAVSQSSGSSPAQQQPQPEKKNDMGEAAKKGLNVLKKWF